MGIFIVQAWRNLRRNMRRTLITITAAALGAMVLVLTFAMLKGFNIQLVDGVSRMTGHLTVSKRGYRRTGDFDLRIRNPESIIRTLEKLKWVRGVAPRIVARGLVRSTEEVRGRGARILGIDPVREPRFIFIHKKIIKGSPLPTTPPGPKAVRQLPSILLGTRMAKRLAVDVGGKVVVGTSTVSGRAGYISFKVCGIFKVGMKQVDGGLVLVNRRVLAAKTGLKRSVHRVVVKTEDGIALAPLVKKLARRFKKQKLEVVPWWRSSPDVKSMVQMMDIFSYLACGFIFLIALLGVMNTMLMSVFERTRELGVMMSLGVRPARIRWLVMWEGAFISVVAVAIGTFAGWGLTELLDMAGGFPLQMFMGDYTVGGAGLDPVMWMKNSVEGVVWPAVSIVLSALGASMYPAWKASRLRPARAIQFT